MKFCLYCGHENSDDAIFCVVDGSVLRESDVDKQNYEKETQACDKCELKNNSEMENDEEYGNVIIEKTKS